MQSIGKRLPSLSCRKYVASYVTSAINSTGPVKTEESICRKDTVMPGLAWLKGQAPVMAKEDEAYPSWLWSILEPKIYSEEEMEPGGKGFKAKLRKERRKEIRMSNFMKTQ